MFYKPIFKTWSMEMGVGKNLNCRHPAARVIAVIKACVTKGRTTCLFGYRVPHHISSAFRCFCTEHCNDRTFQRAKRKEAAPSLVISAPAVCSLGSHWAALLCCFHCCSRCLMFAKQLCPFGHRSLCGVLCFFFFWLGQLLAAIHLSQHCIYVCALYGHSPVKAVWLS